MATSLSLITRHTTVSSLLPEAVAMVISSSRSLAIKSWMPWRALSSLAYANCGNGQMRQLPLMRKKYLMEMEAAQGRGTRS